MPERLTAARLSAAFWEALTGAAYCVGAAIPVILVTSSVIAIQSEVDSIGLLLVGYAVYVIAGIPIIVASVLVIGIPVFMIFDLTIGADLPWLIAVGAFVGAGIHVAWLGWPNVAGGMDDIFYLVVLFAGSGGLSAAAFWYGTQKHK